MSRIVSNRYTVVHHIGFDPIEYLDSVFFPGTVGVRKALGPTMISDGNGFMSPFGRLGYQIPDGVSSIHGTHIGMQMQFHPFFIIGSVVFPWRMLDFHQVLGKHDQISLEGIFLDAPPDFQPHAFGDIVKDLLVFFPIGEFLHDKRRRIVGDFHR